MAKRGSTLTRKTKKKKGLAKAKMSNIQKLKHAKRGEMTEAQRKKKKADKKEEKQQTYAEVKRRRERAWEAAERFKNDTEVYPLSAEVTGEEMMKMMDPEDLTYLVKKQGHKRKFDDEEEEVAPYEEEERDFNKDKLPDNIKSLLPIKTTEGQVVPRFTHLDEEKKNEDPSPIEEEQEPVKEEMEEEVEKKEVEKTTVEFLADRQTKLEDRKVRIGCLAANFLQQPEERLSGLSALLEFMDEADPDVQMTVKKYAALSLLQVFHHIIPSYTIKTIDTDQKLKKETRQLYFYESHLLSAYQKYLKGLEAMVNSAHAKKANNQTLKHLCLVGVKCLGELLAQHSHFNFTSNLVQALTPLLNHADDEVCKMVFSFFFKIFKDDVSGALSNEIVRRIDQVVRRRGFRVRPEVLGVLMGLRMRGVSSLDSILDEKLAAKKKLTHKEKLVRKLLEQQKSKRPNKEVKMIRKQRKLEEEMKEIRKERTNKSVNKHHAAMIQTVFGLYVHVLKRRPNNKLNPTVLEGLAKFAHLVNIEYFADLLTTLGALMNEGSLKLRESLHCIQVVFTILAGQGQVLTLDPTSFYQYLYANIFNISAGVNHDDIVTVVESLRQMLVERGTRAGQLRILAFTKHLASLSLTLLHSGAIVSLAILRSIMLGHKCTEALLEVDSEGTSGVYQAEATDPQHCNPAATSLWDFHIMKRHYHETVQQMALHLVNGAPVQGVNSLPYTLTKRTTDELYQSFSSSEMRFNPAIPPPGHHLTGQTKRQMGRKKQGQEQWATEYMAIAAQDVGQPYYRCITAVNNKGKDTDQKLVDADFHSGMLGNMNIDHIPLPAMSEDHPDCTRSLICLNEA